jgi:PPOX class probable F420-dependent enzyme
MSEPVGADRVREFLGSNHHAVLATFRRDGRTQLSPVLAVVDDEGRVLISTREPAMKVRNLRRDARVSLAVLSDGFFGEWYQIEGIAEIVDQPEALDVLDDYYRRAAGEHPDWAEYREAMIRDRRVVIRFAIDRAGPNVEG